VVTEGTKAEVVHEFLEGLDLSLSDFPQPHRDAYQISLVDREIAELEERLEGPVAGPTEEYQETLASLHRRRARLWDRVQEAELWDRAEKEGEDEEPAGWQAGDDTTPPEPTRRRGG